MWADHLIHQLAWKILHPKPQPPPAGRGPSWTWASVDGAVESPYWDANPWIDSTTLLAHVVDAATTAVDGDDFGYVSGGTVRLYGSLSALQLCGPYEPQNPKETGLEGVSIFWDTQELAERYGETKDCRWAVSPRRKTPNTLVRKHETYESSFEMQREELGSKDIFYMPLRMMGEDPDVSYDISLIGLLLTPTGKGKGQFRRIGQAEAYEQELKRSEILQLFARLKYSSAILHSDYFVESDGDCQFFIDVV